MFEKSDKTLIALALKGKESAWLTLVKRYEKNLYNYALRMVNNPTDAMDLMQDIFIALFRSLDKFRGECPFKNWLFKIAHYRCLEFYRRKRPMQSLDDVPEQEDADTVCLEKDLHIQQQSSALLEAMQNLPVKQKLVVELKFFQQCTFEDISQQLGISTNTAKSQLYSALDKLKMQLTDDSIRKVEVEYV
ncbi:RNA polymerase subunit sigma-70 [Colwellia sp. 75C3]|uniref:RNA polymerase sigma factor n=1 Tax=Colwellia sp. 75C3 TaxID=888425 RepID=UPI000C344ACB|nr:sigma-70 family RNA polymerase sigma factor [Colwellia sp. 75C3]PKG86003.1 RNA polymerase subunit sigma-70 [Colwellia sp. 75C3]